MVSIDDVKALGLKVAEIVGVDDHPNADRLYVLSIRIGEESRTLVAGIKRSYSKEELIGKKIVVITNMKPAVIRGVESQGMLLAADGGDEIVLISPEKDVPSGSEVR